MLGNYLPRNLYRNENPFAYLKIWILIGGNDKPLSDAGAVYYQTDTEEQCTHSSIRRLDSQFNNVYLDKCIEVMWMFTVFGILDPCVMSSGLEGGRAERRTGIPPGV